jgi:hypothetical protein
MDGPMVAGEPYGFVAKTGGWLWGDDNYCYESGTGQVVSPYISEDTADWQILEGELSTGDNNFLPNFFLTLENVSSGKAFVDYVWIEEVLGNGQYGPNIVSKPWMAHHQYFEQRNSYAFDKTLELAERYDLYFKLVVLEKNEWIFNRIDDEGRPIAGSPACRDDDDTNDPEKCPGNDWFYGHGRQLTKVRWLQQSWWRYLQARWGYSPNIHSWELLNEGDPFNGRHYALADEFGKYMHQFQPNDHLVTTSFWHSFPAEKFWANPDYPNLDYADLHAYATDSPDTAANSVYYSQLHGAFAPEGAGKPLVRGETGFSDAVTQDQAGVWLHNYIWAGINSGGMVELYWYSREHIVQNKQDNDLRYHYAPYRNFMADIPLNNGLYQDTQAESSNETLRVWGQKDLDCSCAHLWIQNQNNTWPSAAKGLTPPPADSAITLSGFSPNQRYALTWWDTYQLDPARQVTATDTVTADESGTISIAVTNLSTDVAIKIAPQN